MHSSGFAGAGHGISRFRPNGIPSSPHGMRVTLLRTSVKKSKFGGIGGAGERDRTSDLLITDQLA
jgi:hypothetical protein